MEDRFAETEDQVPLYSRWDLLGSKLTGRALRLWTDMDFDGAYLPFHEDRRSTDGWPYALTELKRRINLKPTDMIKRLLPDGRGAYRIAYPSGPWTANSTVAYGSLPLDPPTGTTFGMQRNRDRPADCASRNIGQNQAAGTLAVALPASMNDGRKTGIYSVSDSPARSWQEELLVQEVLRAQWPETGGVQRSH